MSKLYRFALVGLAGSGKTCILTALTLPRVANSEGYSATWVQHPTEAIIGDEGILKAYADGDKVLRSAQDRLEQHLPPDKTLLSTMRFRFDFGVTEGRTYATELIDYSGELLNPEVKEDEAADKLRGILNDCDALLVLAEAPRPGDDRQPSYKAARQLMMAIARLNSRRGTNGPPPRKPVVLLLNKWDRRETASRCAESRSQQVQAFLDENPEPPQKSLINALLGGVAPDCFHILAVSAFGASRIERTRDKNGIEKTDKELPSTEVPLPSFGLEDGFIWAARKCDALEMEAFRREAEANTQAWRPWLPVRLNRLRDQGRQLARRFPEHTPEHQELVSQNRRLGWVARGRVASFVTLLLIGMLFSFGGMTRYMDVRTIGDVEAHLNSPDAGDEVLANDADWLESYLRSPGPRHRVTKWVQSNNQMQELLARVNDRREDLAMKPIDAAPDLLAKLPHAKRYLERFPNGRHLAKVMEIVAGAEAVAKNAENLAHLEAIKNKLPVFIAKTALKEEDFRELERLNGNIAQLPYPESLSAQLLAEKEKLRSEIGVQLVRAGVDIFVTRLQQHLDAEELVAACNLVRPTPPRSHQREIGVKKIWSVASSNFANFRMDGKWKKCRDLLDNMQQGFVAAGLPSKEQLGTLQLWKEQTNLGEDRKLYEDVAKYQNRESCQAYLTAAPLGHMKAEVKAYLGYLESLREPLELTYVFHKFHMGKRPSTIYDLETQLDIYCNDEKVSHFWTNCPFAMNTTLDKELYRQSFTAKLSDPAKVKFKMDRGGIFSRDSMGEKEWTGLVRDMNNLCIEVPIPGQSSQDSQSRVYLRLEGIPEPTPLTSYAER